MAIGGFGIGTGEFVIMGLLPEVAEQTHVPVTEAAHAITAYALGVVVGAPVIAVLAARRPRHVVLAALMAWFALGNLASALAAGLPWLVAARFLAGLPHGAYFGVASLVAASLALPGPAGAGCRPDDARVDRRDSRGRPACHLARPVVRLACRLRVRRPDRRLGLRDHLAQACRAPRRPVGGFCCASWGRSGASRCC